MPQKTTPIPTKRCPRCQQYKPINEFGKNVTKGDGLQSYCKKCNSIYATHCRKDKKNGNEKKVISTKSTSPSSPEFKGSSITKRNFNDISQVYIDKYIGEIRKREIKNEKSDTIIKQPTITVSNPSLNDLILEAKVKLTILTHLKEVGES